MIKFRYTVNKNIVGLIQSTFADVANPNSLVGYVEKQKLSNTNILHHSSLFLVCDCEFKTGDKAPTNYKNPIAVVAKNQTEAVGVYNSIFKTDEGVVICELEHRCDELEVEQI